MHTWEYHQDTQKNRYRICIFCNKIDEDFWNQEEDPNKSAKAKYRAKIKAIRFSTVEDFPEDEIKGWPAGIVDDIIFKIYEITGIDNPFEDEDGEDEEDEDVKYKMEEFRNE